MEHIRSSNSSFVLNTKVWCMRGQLNQRLHIVGTRKTVRSIDRQWIICRCHSIKPQNQQLGRLPTERVSVAEKSGVDYAGPFQIKYGHVRKLTIVKTYICLFVCMLSSQGSSLGVCLWYNYRSLCSNTPSLHCQSWLFFPNLEWPRLELRGSQEWIEGTSRFLIHAVLSLKVQCPNSAAHTIFSGSTSQKNLLISVASGNLPWRAQRTYWNT